MTPAAVLSARQSLGMTQAAFAAALGVTPRAVSNWENGHRSVSPMAVRLIASMLRENWTPLPPNPVQP